MRNIYTKDGIVKMKIGGIWVASGGSWDREQYLKLAHKYYGKKKS